MYRKIYLGITIIIISLIAAGIPVAAGDGLSGSRFVYGARPIGLSNAFTAMDGDVNGVSYNPAGIATISKNIFSTFYTNPGQFKWYKQYNLSVAIPAKFGVSVLSYSGNDISFDYTDINPNWDKLNWLESSLMYSIGLKLNQQSLLGLNIDYSRVKSNVDGGGAKGLSFDIGYIGMINNDFSVGISLKNLYSSKKWDTGKNEDEDLEYRFGIRYDILDRLNILGDITGVKTETLKTLNVGSEFIVWESVRFKNEGNANVFKRSGSDFYPENLAFVLRFGLEKDLYLDKDLRYSAGMSFGAGMTKLDYAYKYDNNGLNDQQHYFSVGFGFGNDITKKYEDEKIEEEQQQPPLPYSASYQNQQVGNKQQNQVQSPAAPQKKRSRLTEIAVINFKIVMNNSQQNWLSTGIPDMIIRNLYSTSKVNIKNRNEVSEMVSMVTSDASRINAELASQVGILVNADLILVGTFEIYNEKQIVIRYKLFNTDTRKEVFDRSVNGTLIQIFGLIEQISTDVGNMINLMNMYHSNSMSFKK
ncbi:hypothetical protein KA977_00230 [Candidatus Dependentiae bacterium]|nr:hypothetical protein [Candidatus Dependentiae bacterium]